MPSLHVRPFLFAGPTLSRARAIAPLDLEPYILEPPAERGTIAAMAARHPAGCAILVDGLFHESLAVGHAELRDAIRSGWQIWGLSSMGAIRAREMHPLGMRGFGRVFERYCQDDDFRDDEVALLHAPEPPYRELSEPLVHVRAALAAAVADARLSSDEHVAILGQLTACWYGERTLARVRDAVVASCPSSPAWVNAWLASFDAYRWKALDLIDFVAARPWATAG
ncbi:MAG: TfuA domain-containing protein [Deltaproteobacteria bacterium]|nr:TfuA domain-containing protein [Deltaproteobacteria bacterium]